MCKISVIIPVFNDNPNLRNCLNSVLSQECVWEYEVIIVNDGSTDDVLSFLSEFKEQNTDKSVRIVSIEHSGVSVARNVGMEIAKGEYIAFVDSDDHIEKDYLSAFYYQYDIELQGVDCVAQRISLDELFNQPNALELYPNLHGKVFCQSFLIRHRLTFDSLLAVGEDRDFVTRIITLDDVRIGAVRQNLYHYDVRIDSLSHQRQDGRILYQIAVTNYRMLCGRSKRVGEVMRRQWMLEGMLGIYYAIVSGGQSIKGKQEFLNSLDRDFLIYISGQKNIPPRYRLLLQIIGKSQMSFTKTCILYAIMKLIPEQN